MIMTNGFGDFSFRSTARLNFYALRDTRSPSQFVPRLTFTPNLRLMLLLQLFCMQPLKPLGYALLFHLPALPYGSKACGDFIVI